MLYQKNTLKSVPRENFTLRYVGFAGHTPPMFHVKSVNQASHTKNTKDTCST